MFSLINKFINLLYKTYTYITHIRIHYLLLIFPFLPSIYSVPTAKNKNNDSKTNSVLSIRENV